MDTNFMKEMKEWILSIIAAAIIAFLIKAFLFDIIQVSGRSMIPTLHNNDRIAVEKISLYRHSFKRGQIIIFDSGKKEQSIYIKRLIGLPGDKVEISNGLVYVNDELLKEDYLKPGTYTDIDLKLTVPEGKVFVLGDNREVSEDSRYLGPIDISKLKGRAIFRIYPFNDMKTFK